jgi:predicted transcriptional regulator
MAKKSKGDIKQEFGAFLAKHRIEVLKAENLLEFSYTSKFDNSKLRKIEKGQIDFRFDTLIEIARTYKLPEKVILGFKFDLED